MHIEFCTKLNFLEGAVRCIGAWQRVGGSVHGELATTSAARLLSRLAARMVALEASMADLSPEQLAAAREARNGSCSALLVTLGHIPDAAQRDELSSCTRAELAARTWCAQILAAWSGRKCCGPLSGQVPI